MKNLILFLGLQFLAVFAVKAQMQQSFFMDNTPVSQTYQIAMKPTWKFYIGIPLHDLNFGVHTTGANFGDLFFKESGSFTTIFDNNLSESRKLKFLNDIQSHVLMGTDIRITPFSMGWTRGRNSFSLGISQRLDVQMDMPRELFRVILLGTEQMADGTDMSGTSLSLNTFTELSFTYRREISEAFSFAIRPKIYSGTGYIALNGNQLSMTSLPNARLLANITGQTAGAMQVRIENGKYRDIEFDSNGFGRNLGFGIDLAADYQSNRLNLGAGIHDIGFIRWTHNAQEYQGTGDLEIDPQEGQDFEKSLEESLQLTANPREFTTTLNAVPFFSARYDLHEAFSAGALLYGHTIGNRFKPILTLGANIQASKSLEAALTYTLREKSYANLGAALSARLGVFQLYLASDNLLSLINHEKANYLNIRTGLNFIMGQRAKLSNR